MSHHVYDYEFTDRMEAGKQAAMDARNRGRALGNRKVRQHKRPIEDTEINRAYAELAGVQSDLREAKNEIAVLKLHATTPDYGAEFDKLVGAGLAPCPKSLPDHASPRGKPGPQTMTTQQYLDALQELGLTRAGKATAAALGIGIRQCIRLAQGTTPISRTIELLIKQYLEHGLPT